MRNMAEEATAVGNRAMHSDAAVYHPAPKEVYAMVKENPYHSPQQYDHFFQAAGFNTLIGIVKRNLNELETDNQVTSVKTERGIRFVPLEEGYKELIDSTDRLRQLSEKCCFCNELVSLINQNEGIGYIELLAKLPRYNSSTMHQTILDLVETGRLMDKERRYYTKLSKIPLK